MRLFEYQAKQLFAEAGLPTPPGAVAGTPEEAAAAAQGLGRVVVKAQVHVGGRGKAGFIKLAGSPEEAAEHARRMLGADLKGYTVHQVLIEQALDIAKEYYLGAVLDRDGKQIVLLFSTVGGMDIEEVAATAPDKLIRLTPDPLVGPQNFELQEMAFAAGVDPKVFRAVVGAAAAVWKLFQRYDASLVEINPLVVTGRGEVVAADGKFEVDDSALYRHPELERFRQVGEEDPLEAEARKRGLNYVRLSGDIGIMANGAGLAMNTMDVVAAHGGKPANFLDVSGGARADVVRSALDLILQDKKVKGVFINIFGGITRGDEVARGVVEGVRQLGVQVPIVVRMAGTREEEGRAILREANLVPATSAADGAEKIIALLREKGA
jgi:succinyl-CoA synthetase beta subunit